MDNDKSFPDICPNRGNNRNVKRNANKSAIPAISTDSPRNCRRRDFFSAPSTLRTPTSAARLEEEDVDRFIKLIQAISRVRTAMEARINNDVLLPPGVTLPSTPERCISCTGVRK